MGLISIRLVVYYVGKKLSIHLYQWVTILDANCPNSISEASRSRPDLATTTFAHTNSIGDKSGENSSTILISLFSTLRIIGNGFVIKFTVFANM
jgi:hypothetical protein